MVADAAARRAGEGSLLAVAAAEARPQATAGGALGTGYALAAFALYSATDTVLKHLTGAYHPFQVSFFNALFAFVPYLAMTAHRGWGSLRTRRPHLHALRGLLSAATTGCICFAIGRLPLADAYAVLFAVPALVTALAVPLLGERAGWGRWAAVAVGFSGVLLALNPDGALWGWGGVAAAAGAVCNALGVILVRGSQPGETREALSVYGNLAACLGMGATLPFVWTAPALPDVLLSAVAGLVSGSGFLLLLQAYRLSPAASVAPCQYTQMPYALAIGFLLFDARPETWTLAGAALVMASGLLLLRGGGGGGGGARR
jgi:S-adenosylmethionine uptake transporter